MDIASSFYPRHPRGWRPGRLQSRTYQDKFLSTPPSRVATQMGMSVTSKMFLFLSTPPSRVATLDH